MSTDSHREHLHCIYCGHYDFSFTLARTVDFKFPDFALHHLTRQKLPIRDNHPWPQILAICPFDQLITRTTGGHVNKGSEARVFQCANRHFVYLWRTAKGDMLWR